MRLPNLMLIGAPKCGTSSLYQWLAEHPEVTTADDKELFYVVDRDSPFRKAHSNADAHGIEGYRQYFRRAAPHCRWALEGTTHTLYQHSAIAFLERLPQLPHVIAVLRRPADRVYSSFRFSQHHLARFTRPIGFADFRRMLEADDTDALQRLVPFQRSLYVLRHDVLYSQYIDWLLAWRQAFGERLHVVLLEDLKANPTHVMGALCEALSLDGNLLESDTLPQSNRTVQPRHRMLHGWIRSLRRWVPKQAGTVALYRRYLRMQQTPVEGPTSEDREVLAHLDHHFEPYNERLAQVFKLDLQCWQRT